MCKNSISLLVLVFLFAIAGQSVAFTDPNLSGKKKVETDSLNVNKDKNTLLASEVKSKPSKSETISVNFWNESEEVEEDSTSNSALSFNFIYYVIEKFKFQVE
jgi:hypothetical protein